MDNDKIIRSIIDKCDVYYDDLLISSEEIVKRYIQFFSSQLSSDGKVTSFAFHTGSLCFDIASIATLLIACFTYNLRSNAEVLCSLEMGDMVLYNGERYRWGGIEKGVLKNNPELEYMVLMQDAKGKNGTFRDYVPFERNKHKVRPYLGESVVTDGRGIRKGKNNRDEFLSCILGIPECDVPSTLDISIVVISDKGVFIDICQHLNIAYGENKRVQLTDIVPVAYYSGNGEEIQIGRNSSKAEAVIKAVSKVSVARDIVLDKRGNKTVGLLVINSDSVQFDASEFKDMIRRKTLRFAIIASVYDLESIDLAIEQYEEASFFACTKDMLKSVSAEVISPNKLTRELGNQIKNIIERETEVISVEGCWRWEQYKSIKDAIYTIRQSNWIEKEDFVLSAMALLNLFLSTFFSMRKMEEAISCGKINSAVVSPKVRIQNMYEISKTSFSMKQVCDDITEKLLDMYTDLLEESPKENFLREILSRNEGKKIALVVSKAYYVDLFKLYFCNHNEDRYVTCITANRFDSREQYDLILVSGDIVGKKFDVLQCYASAKIKILLYDCEGRLFDYRKSRSVKSERRMDARIKGLAKDESEQDIGEYKVEKDEGAWREVITKFTDLDDFVESVGMFDIRKMVNKSSGLLGYSGTAEVNYVGTFVTGEQIMFSKYYSAVVYDRMAQKVIETSPDKLVSGDVIVFTKRNEYTRNIVDMIFEQLMLGNKLTKKVQDAAEKASYWKEILREYKRVNKLNYRDIAKELKKYGSTLQEATIRQWLDEESHIVGPRNEETMEMIARLTRNEDMLADSKGYFEGCRIIRHYRREILALIAQAINDKLSNKVPEQGSIFEVVYEHVEKLSETMELESVYELEETAMISNGLVNRPIMEKEVLL